MAALNVVPLYGGNNNFDKNEKYTIEYVVDSLSPLYKPANYAVILASLNAVNFAHVPGLVAGAANPFGLVVADDEAARDAKRDNFILNTINAFLNSAAFNISYQDEDFSRFRRTIFMQYYINGGTMKLKNDLTMRHNLHLANDSVSCRYVENQAAYNALAVDVRNNLIRIHGVDQLAVEGPAYYIERNSLMVRSTTTTHQALTQSLNANAAAHGVVGATARGICKFILSSSGLTMAQMRGLTGIAADVYPNIRKKGEKANRKLPAAERVAMTNADWETFSDVVPDDLMTERSSDLFDKVFNKGANAPNAEA